MIYNSFLYITLFPFLFLLLHAIKKEAIKKYFLLAISYALYYYYNQSLAAILLVVTLISYTSALLIERNKGKERTNSTSNNRSKLIVYLGALLTTLPLLFYKYTDFILTEVLYMDSLSSHHTLIVPLGISFFTFQALSYLFDVYRDKYQAEHHLPTYMLYISFFPSITAGPINRYDALRCQLSQLVRPNYQQLANGAKMIVWGMFLKTVIADRLLLYVNPVLDGYMQHSGSELLAASVLYSIQLYTDFAGYSLIAIGSASMLGIRLQQNFHNPYFAHSVTDFWHRWHISLSQWLRDYIYIPIGGNRCSKRRTYLNIIITFLISGIWHGANWTFILWGVLHGFFQVMEKMLSFTKESRNTEHKVRQRMRRGISILINFLLINFLWIFFRMPSVGDAFHVIGKIFTEQDMNFWVFEKFILLFILMVFAKDLIVEVTPSQNPFHHPKLWVRWCTYIVVTTSIFLFGVFDSGQFIYAGF